MNSLLLDLRFALRSLTHRPVYALVVILTLALGIGANTALFSVVNGVLLGDLPYAEGERIVRLRQEAPAAGGGLGFSPPEIEDYAARSGALDAVVEYHSMPFTFLGREEPERLQTGVVSAEYFDVLGVTPLLGRSFRPGEDQPGAEPVLILSFDYWSRELGADPDVLGTAFEMNDRLHTVVGVLPPLPPYPDDNALYMPASSCPFRASIREVRRGRMLSAFGRLAPGASPEALVTDLDRVSASLVTDHPGDYPQDAGFQALARPLAEELTHRARPTFLLLLTAVGFVLLIVCANVANLTLARRLERDRELAVRAALGAGRGRLVRQLLTESTLLALAGGALGLLLARGVLHLLVDFAARFTPRALEIQLDLQVLLFTLVLSLGAGLLFGLAPALSNQRSLASALYAGGGRGATGGGGLQRSLVVAQVAISFVLLVAAGLTLESFFNVLRIDPGFRTEKVSTVTVDLNWSKYNDGEKYRDFFRPLLEEVADAPGIEVAALGGAVPLGSGGPMQGTFRVEGQPVDNPDLLPRADLRVVSPLYFEVLGVPRRAGRTFTSFDREDTDPVAMVSEGLAQRHWGTADTAVGQRLSFDDGTTWIQVAGVVGDVRQYGFDREAAQEIYIPFEQNPMRRMSLLVTSSLAPSRVTAHLREAVHRLDPEQPVTGVATLDELRRESLASRRLTTTLLALLGALALLVTTSGLGGLLAFTVSQRTREIGIRMALGAPRARVLRRVLGQGLALVALGLLLGTGLALATGRYLESLLYGITGTDALTYLLVGLGFATVATLAGLGPALRASSVDPLRALGEE